MLGKISKTGDNVTDYVAVCGAGSAVLVTAVKLTELGYKVIVLEKAKKADTLEDLAKEMESILIKS